MIYLNKGFSSLRAICKSVLHVFRFMSWARLLTHIGAHNYTLKTG